MSATGGKHTNGGTASCGAGIGGGSNGHAEDITINGGTVTATNLAYGAGIGGGQGGHGKRITINGGTVNALNHYRGAGIGGGYGNDGEDITIRGGEITAICRYEGAGIGGGPGGSGKNIKISGGTVTANANGGGAGIGGGPSGHAENITINGGTVTAKSNSGGAGIGGGCYCDGKDIAISGGTVNASGGGDGSGAGIGGGGGGNGQSIAISGGTVNATGSNGSRFGSGIGGGNGGDGIGITISGGTVTAKSHGYAAAIGGGWKGSGKDIAVSGGLVNAYCDVVYGAGIGGGGDTVLSPIYLSRLHPGDCANVTISGGTIFLSSRGISGGGCRVALTEWPEDYSTTENVTISGGSINGKINCTPKNSSGAEVLKTTVTGVEESPAQIGGLGSYGVNDLYPDDGKNLYLWLPSGSYSFHTTTNKYSGDAGKTFGSSGAWCGIAVDGIDAGVGTDAGWSCANGVLTLSQAKAYTLTGTNTAGNLRVQVTANAKVTLNNVTLSTTNAVSLITFTSAAADATLTLKGVNTVYGAANAILVQKDAKLTVQEASAGGSLVGRGNSSSGKRCIHNDGTLILKGGTIRNYITPAGWNGGCIYNAGAFTMDGGTISGCQSTGNGGAVCNDAGTFTMDGGTISGCKGSYGGGLYVVNGTAELNAGTISGCAATFGGALALLNSGTVNVRSGMTVSANSALSHGAVFLQGGTVNVWGGTFTDNTVYTGVLTDWAGTLNVYGGVFGGNSVKPVYQSAVCGGVYDRQPEGIVDGSAARQIGSNYVVGQDVATRNGQLVGGTYTFNPAHDEYAAAGVKVANGCSVAARGTTPETYVIDDPAEFRVNGTALVAPSGEGWTYDRNTGLLTLTEARAYTLTGIASDDLHVEVTTNANVTLNQVTLSNWSVGVNGIDFTSGATNATLTLNGENRVFGPGNAICIRSGAKVTIREASAGGSLVGSGNSSSGRRCIHNDGTLVLDSGTLKNYIAPSAGNGGCIYNTGTFLMNGGAISGCTATYGGGLYVVNGTAELNAGTISGCAATYGGALVLWNSGTVNVRSGMVISGNSAVSHGAVFQQGGTVNVWGGTFRNNAVATGVLTDWIGTLNVYGGVFADNSVKPVYRRDGSVVAVAGGVYDVAPDAGVVVDGSAAPKVGGLYIVGTNVVAKNGQLTGGTYTFDPKDAEYAAAGVAVMGNCTVTAHPETTPETYVVHVDAEFRVNGALLSTGSGTGWTFEMIDDNTGHLSLNGAMDYALSGYCNVGLKVDVTADAKVSLTDIRIHAGDLGCAVFNVTASDARFSLGGTNEVYTTDGHAAIGVAANAKLTLDGDGALVGGKAADKTCLGVSVTNGTFVMNGGAISGYKGGSYGGGLYVKDGTAELNAGTITDCSATYGGALALWNSGTVNIRSGMTISGNSAVSHGAVFQQGGTVNVWGGTFRNNAVATGVLTDWAGTLNVYGGVFGGNSVKPVLREGSSAVVVCGGVYDEAPDAGLVVSGYVATQVGGLYVIGNGLTQEDGALTGGTYTFDPGREEYAAAGVAVAPNFRARAQGTTPETYVVVKAAEFKVDGVQLMYGPGEGWTFDVEEGLLTLSAARAYELTGFADLPLKVDVLSNATVTLNGIGIRAGNIGRAIFNVTAADATFVLKGTNEVYASDGHAAIGVGAFSKLTVTGNGELAGGRAAGANGRGFAVAAGGTLILEGGTIRDYYTSDRGAVVYNMGATAIYGGVFCGNTVTPVYQAAVYGGVYDVTPEGIVSGYAATKVGENYIVGQGVTEKNGQLTGGTYTFNPVRDEYAAVGVTVALNCLARAQGTDPETYVVVKEAEFKVDGVQLMYGPGEGWTFDVGTGLLTLSAARAYELTGFADRALKVDVTEDATVTLNGISVHAGALGRAVFNVTASDATFVLVGTNEIYATDGHSAIGVAANAKLTLTGDGALVGGKAADKTCLGVSVNGGTFVMNGTAERSETAKGCTISGYKGGSYGGGLYVKDGTAELNAGAITDCSATYGGALALWNSGTVNIRSGMTISGNSAVSHGAVFLQGGTVNVWGGTFADNAVATGVLTDWTGTLNVYGGVFGGNSVKPVHRRDASAASVFGGVYDEAPDAGLVVSGSAATQVGDKYVVGKDVTQENGALTGGTYTFNPKNAEYAAAGVTLGAVCEVRTEGTDPVTYVVYKEAEFKVNGVLLATGSGEGWTFDAETKQLTLAAPTNFTLTGYSDLASRIDVLSNATVTLDGIGIRTGANGRSIFTVFAEDATFVLKGTSEVYTTDGNAAVFVTAGAKLTVMGNGELAGGRAAGANGRGFHVYGTLVVESGTIRDYYTTGNGGAVCNNGTFTMIGGTISGSSANYGGAFHNNGTTAIYGGMFADCTARLGGSYFASKNGRCDIYGGYFAHTSGAIFDCDYLKVAFHGCVTAGFSTQFRVVDIMHLEGSDLYVYGRDMTQAGGALTGGTYTFNPADDLYAAAGVAVAAEHVVLALETDPATYAVDWNWTDFTVDGVDLVLGSGDGWSYDFASGVLTLSAAKTYVLSGALTRKGLDLGVSVETGATVVLSNATIVSSACAPIAVNAAGVSVRLKGDNRLEVAALDGASALPAVAVADGASVTIGRSEEVGGKSEEVGEGNLDAVGGADAVAIGGEGNVTITSGVIEARGGIAGNAVSISGGTVSATGRNGAADIDGTDVRITGGSVVAGNVTNPRDADGASVWCVTVPDVEQRGPVAITNVAYLAESYGQTDLYPISGALCLWLPNGTYNGYYVGDDPEPYYATVASEPTVAIRKILALYVNDELVTAPEHAEGWSYADGVLTLDGTTNSYVIAGESMDGAVRIVVEEDAACDVTISGVRLGKEDLESGQNLITFGAGARINLVLDGLTAFRTNDGIAPIRVEDGATVNICGSGTVYAWKVDIEGSGRVTMEDPTALTFTTRASAEAAADVVKPLADESDFPGIDQVAYGNRFVVSAVAGESGLWTLDYQVSAATSNELRNAISSVSTLSNLVASISSTNRTASVTFTPIPGFYYGMAGTTEVTEMDSDAARPSAWYAGQEGEDLTVSGMTFLDAVKAFYQLKVSEKP